MNINWKQKLSSRKFWALVIALCVSVAVMVNAPPDTIERVTGLVSAIGACVMYMFVEGTIDTKSK